MSRPRYIRHANAEQAMATLKQDIENRRMVQAVPALAGGNATTIEELLNQHGRYWLGRKRPKGLYKMANRMCFANAQALAMCHPERYTYCEGLATSVVTTLHAWLIDREGQLVDPTWGDPQKCAYFGTPFKHDYVRDVILATGHHVSLYDNYQQKWPLLTGKVDIKEVLHEA